MARFQEHLYFIEAGGSAPRKLSGSGDWTLWVYREEPGAPFTVERLWEGARLAARKLEPAASAHLMELIRGLPSPTDHPPSGCDGLTLTLFVNLPGGMECHSWWAGEGMRDPSLAPLVRLIEFLEERLPPPPAA